MIEITLRRGASVDALKQLKTIEIDGTPLKISWKCDMEGGSMGPVCESLQTPPAQNLPNHILNAWSDDIFCALFESKMLSIGDICAFATTNKRLSNIAAKVLQTIDKKCALNQDTMALWQWECYFHICGESLKQINISLQPRANIILNLIAKHCVKVFDITCTLDQRKFDIGLRPLFARLSTLYVTLTDGICLADFIPVRNRLKFLTIYTKDEVLAPIKLSTLIELNLMVKGLGIRELAEAFFELNPHLKRLRIGGRKPALLNFSVSHMLCYLPNLENLKLHISDPSDDADYPLFYQAFREMKLLKQLRITNALQSNILAAVFSGIKVGEVPLKDLYLNQMRTNFESIQLVGQIKSIETLDIIMNALGDDGMIQLLACLPNLTDAQIQSTKITLKGIRRYIQIARPSVTTGFRLGVYKSWDILLRYTHIFHSIENDLLARGDNLRLSVCISLYSNVGHSRVTVSYYFFFCPYVDNFFSLRRTFVIINFDLFFMHFSRNWTQSRLGIKIG